MGIWKYGDQIGLGWLSRGSTLWGIICSGGQKVGDQKSGTKCVAAEYLRFFDKKLTKKVNHDNIQY